MKISVIFHCFYFDLLEEFYGYFSKIGTDFSLFVTIPSDYYREEEVEMFKSDILKHYPNAVIISCNNYGADIYPCFCVMDYIKRKNLHFDKYIKVHTKKSLWKRNKQHGMKWRKNLCACIFNDFSNKVKKKGLVASNSFALNFLRSNRDIYLQKCYEELLAFYGYPMPPKDIRYSIGTIFMIDGDVWEDFFYNRVEESHINLYTMSDHVTLECFERLWEFLPLFYNKQLHLL